MGHISLFYLINVRVYIKYTYLQLSKKNYLLIGIQIISKVFEHIIKVDVEIHIF